ncbi:MAG: glycoside hydrolase family 127 protein [Kiritimatiellae bacterium]|nr:glycoside hydrolase family 127 protein [Kiritimatiellia bacterium]
MTSRPARVLVPVPFKRVAVEGGFWGPRLETNRTVTLPLEYEQCRKTRRLEALKRTWRPGARNQPHHFWDSDIAKWIEAAAYSLSTHPDPKLRRRVDAVVDLLANGQQEDGYLNTYFTTVAPDARWTNLCHMHELYCAGHLMEAAVAYYAATGRRKLLDVLCRYADHIARTFGPRRGQKRGYPGHEEIELALVKLYRATGERRYLRLASYFVDERGREPHYFDREAAARGEARSARGRACYDYNQAHLPVRVQKTAEGHAVRACYLYAGMADVAAETGDKGLLAACRAIWRNITERRLYVTGAVGSSRFGERFTFDYDLPNETAYAETCANIALVFFAHRMLQIEADSRYADVMERAIYNGVLSGVSLDGTRFFYDNLLAVHPRAPAFNRQKPAGRQEWFGCACCPPNIARFIASLGAYVYSAGRRALYVHLYVAGSASVELDGRPVLIEQKTGYPWTDRVQLTVRCGEPARFALALRVPGWCRRASVKVNGSRVGLAGCMRKGYAAIRRTWRNGDRIELTLPMPVERVEANPHVRQDCGRVALQRGPVVYCLEEVDNGQDLNDITLPRAAKLSARLDRALFGGVPVVTGRAWRRNAAEWHGDLYRPAGSKRRPARIRAVPYFLWANRNAGEMLVWIREG